MKYGDKNTSFFHAKSTTIAQVNKIRGLRDTGGNGVDQKGQMKAVVQEYFMSLEYFMILFSTTALNESEINEIMQSLAPRMTEEAIQPLSQPVTDK